MGLPEFEQPCNRLLHAEARRLFARRNKARNGLAMAGNDDGFAL